MISLTNRAVSALYSVLPQLKAKKEDRLAVYKDAPFAVIRYIEKGSSFENKLYAPIMKKPDGIHQGSYLLRNIKSLNGSTSSSKYYLCKISDVIAITPWIQRLCDIFLEKYYQTYPLSVRIRSLARLQLRDVNNISFEDFAYLVSLLDILIEFAPVHYRTRDDYYRADNGSGPRLMVSPLEQLLIMEREADPWNKYDTVVSSNLLQNSLCVKYRENLGVVSWNGYTQPLKLPILNTFFWDVHGFSLGMLQSRILMLSSSTGGNPTWSPGSFYKGMKRMTGDAPFNTSSCPMLNKELSSCNAVDELTFKRMRRALVLLSAFSFNASFYLSAHYGTPAKAAEPQYIHRSCPSKGCFVRLHNQYVQIPSFVIDRSSSSYTKDVDCSFSQSPLPRFYSGNSNLGKQDKGYGSSTKSESSSKATRGHFLFKDAYDKLIRNQAKPILEIVSKRAWYIANDLEDSSFALIVNGVQSKWPDSLAKAMAFLFVNNIEDRRLENEFSQRQTLMTVNWACDAPASTFGGAIISLFLLWHSSLMRILTNQKSEINDRLHFDPKFAVCNAYTNPPDLSSMLVRQDFYNAVAREAVQILKIDTDEKEVAGLISGSKFPSEVFVPGSMIADASVVYGDVSINDDDLLSVLPSRPSFVSSQFDSADLPENIRIPGAYDFFEQDVDDDPIALSNLDQKQGRTIILDRLNWRVIFDRRDG